VGILTGQRVGAAATSPPEFGEVAVLVNPFIERIPVILGLTSQPVTDGALSAPLILPLFLQFFG
jgi:hypothetical protein